MKTYNKAYFVTLEGHVYLARCQKTNAGLLLNCGYRDLLEQGVDFINDDIPLIFSYHGNTLNLLLAQAIKGDRTPITIFWDNRSVYSEQDYIVAPADKPLFMLHILNVQRITGDFEFKNPHIPILNTTPFPEGSFEEDNVVLDDLFRSVCINSQDVLSFCVRIRNSNLSTHLKALIAMAVLNITVWNTIYPDELNVKMFELFLESLPYESHEKNPLTIKVENKHLNCSIGGHTICTRVDSLSDREIAQIAAFLETL